MQKRHSFLNEISLGNKQLQYKYYPTSQEIKTIDETWSVNRR